ncbi:MAG: ankyrin repeat domain-containing protein [Candidatus Babeliales bacterium]
MNKNIISIIFLCSCLNVYGMQEDVGGSGSQVYINQFSAENINIPDEKGITPLCRCLKEGNSEELQRLLGAGADPNLKSNGEAPLHLACEQFCLCKNAVRILLEAGAKPDVLNENLLSYYYGYAPLHIAVETGNCKEIEELLNAGANPNILIDKQIRNNPRILGHDYFSFDDFDGCTPLHILAAHTYCYAADLCSEWDYGSTGYVINVFINKGADKNAKVTKPGAYYYGFTPLRFTMFDFIWPWQVNNMAIAAKTLIRNGATVPEIFVERLSKILFSRYKTFEISERQIDKTEATAEDIAFLENFKNK